MTREEFQDKGLLDKLENLKIEKYKHGTTFCCVAPTWLISEKTELEDYLDDFQNPKKSIKALRDYACIPATAMRPFFKDPSILTKMADPDMVYPLTEFWLPKPEFYPRSGFNYFIAFDLSVSKDACGGAMVHREFAPGHDIYVLDWSFSMKASYAEPIDYEILRNLVRALKRKGFKIKKLGFDQFQSHDSAMIMAKEGFDVEIVKYHESFAGCGFLWDLIHAGQLHYGLCNNVLIGEASELQVVNSKRIDHLTSGGVFNSKDCWDATVNACVLASQDEKGYVPEYEEA